MKLTKTTIDRLTYQGNNNKPHIVFDDEVPGFAVRVYPSGSKSFLIDYRLNGRQRRMVLGRYGILTLEQARKMAKQRLSEVIGGSDPLDKKNQAQRGETIKSLCNAFLEEYSKKHKRSWGEDKRRIDKHIVPALGNKKIHSLKRSDISSFHNHLGDNHPYEANRNLALLSVMFEYGRKNGFVPEDFINPAKGIQKFKEQKRDRWIKPAEMPALIEAIGLHDNIYVRSAIMLYLLTGVRKNELLKTQWKDIDLERGEMRLPETKSGHVHYVPLCKAAIGILKELPQEEGNPYLLPGRKQGHHLVNIDIPWRQIRQSAGLEDVRLHDLRRTVGSWLATAGHSLHIVGKILNHADISTTQKVYAQLAQDPLKAAMEEHGEKIISITKIREEIETKKPA